MICVVQSGEYGGYDDAKSNRDALANPSPISRARIVAPRRFLLSTRSPYSPSPAVNLPISECNLERILRASCRTYTSPDVLWNRMEGKRHVETGWKE